MYVDFGTVCAYLFLCFYFTCVTVWNPEVIARCLPLLHCLWRQRFFTESSCHWLSRTSESPGSLLSNFPALGWDFRNTIPHPISSHHFWGSKLRSSYLKLRKEIYTLRHLFSPITVTFLNFIKGYMTDD